MQFHDKLKLKMHFYVKSVYLATRSFPKEELYGLTSQLRRSALSVILNYIEGYARFNGKKKKVYSNFLEISYGSLKESKYLIYFSFTENYLQSNDYSKLMDAAEEIGKMLWSVLESID
jgi:four helix bundle protein